MLAVSVRGSSTCLFALCLGLSAACCGSAKHKAPVLPPPETKHDAGHPIDDEDADVPLPRKDSGAPDITPGTPDPGLMGSCAIDSNKIFTVVERDQPFLDTPLAVDPVNSRFALPYISSGSCLDAVYMSSMEGAASSGDPKSDIAVDECSLVNDSVATAMGDQWLVALIDNRMPPYDVWVETYDPAAKKMGEGQRISTGSSVEKELAIATLRTTNTAMLAWSDEDASAGQSLYVRPLDSNGKPTGDAVRIDHSSSLYYHGLAVSQLGADGAGLAYLRYSLDFTTSDIVFVALDATGKPLRGEWVLASNAGPSPSVNLAVDESGGGIVFARGESQTGRELWFQQIDDMGLAAAPRAGSSRAPALRFVNAPFKGIDVSIAKLSASFVVAYRALPAVQATRAEIRLYFLDRFGAVIGNSDISYTSSSGGRTAVQSSYDGRVVIGWSEVDENGKSLTKVVRLPCVGG